MHSSDVIAYPEQKPVWWEVLEQALMHHAISVGCDRSALALACHDLAQAAPMVACLIETDHLLGRDPVTLAHEIQRQLAISDFAARTCAELFLALISCCSKQRVQAEFETLAERATQLSTKLGQALLA